MNNRITNKFALSFFGLVSFAQIFSADQTAALATKLDQLAEKYALYNVPQKVSIAEFKNFLGSVKSDLHNIKEESKETDSVKLQEKLTIMHGHLQHCAKQWNDALKKSGIDIKDLVNNSSEAFDRFGDFTTFVDNMRNRRASLPLMKEAELHSTFKDIPAIVLDLRDCDLLEPVFGTNDKDKPVKLAEKLKEHMTFFDKQHASFSPKTSLVVGGTLFAAIAAAIIGNIYYNKKAQTALPEMQQQETSSVSA